MTRDVPAPTGPAPARQRHGSARWLAWAAPLAVLPFLGKVPALDEETYLFIGAHADWLRPYDWARAWPPYDSDAYVFAHPPLHLLWMKLLSPLAGTLPALRAVAGLPWAGLLGWSVGRLADRGAQNPGLAAGAWLACAVVLLGLSDTLMIDLPATALATFAMAAYREGQEDGAPRGWLWGAGVGLGLAVATKYSMAIVAVPIVAHMARRGWRLEVLAPAAAVVLGVEGWLWAAYGRPHLWEVWSRRHEIPAGPWDDRLLGTLARAALLPLPALLFWTHPKASAAGFGAAIVALALARPADLSAGAAAGLLVLAGLGAASVARAVHAVARSTHRRRRGDRGDALLLGAWAIAGVLGVFLLHKYASARYLLPVAAPFAILLVRSAEDVAGGKALMRVSIGISGALALALALADVRFAAAGAEVGAAAAAEAGQETGRFAGEWSYRYAMERAGWSRWRPDEALPPGTLVAVADNASPGAVPTAAWEPVGRVESADRFPLRVVDVKRGIGLYAETLGPLPFGLARGPLEGATLYRVREAAP